MKEHEIDSFVVYAYRVHCVCVSCCLFIFWCVCSFFPLLSVLFTHHTDDPCDLRRHTREERKTRKKNTHQKMKRQYDEEVLVTLVTFECLINAHNIIFSTMDHTLKSMYEKGNGNHHME